MVSLQGKSHGVSGPISRGFANDSRSYTVEVMSYDIRSKLICTQNLLVQATITGFNYLNPVALENITWKYAYYFPWPLVTQCMLT